MNPNRFLYTKIEKYFKFLNQHIERTIANARYVPNFNVLVGNERVIKVHYCYIVYSWESFRKVGFPVTNLNFNKLKM